MPEPALQFLNPRVVTRLANMELRARLVVEGFITGLHRSPYHGFSVEFAEHRQYMPGDAIRFVDWKIYGRTDRYYIKQYEEETNLRSTIVLDTSLSMGYASGDGVSKLEYGASLAAALAYLMIRQQDAVGLACFDEELRSYLPPHTTRAYLRRLLINLKNARPSGKTGAARSLHQAADRMKRRGLVIVISDLLDDPAGVIGALKHFRHKKNEVIVMHVLDPLERTFAFGSDAVFRDVETAERITTLPWQIQASYRGAMARFLEAYKRECREHAIDYVMMDTATPFDVALTEYLARRERLH
ncbi:MAG TPA: DUF58 domain-containing protein [Bacteroidota bacterium]|nr:DUF58 domain-containing protein [Bacteroidota bacterium]